MSAYRKFKNYPTAAIIFLFFITISDCALKGYQIDLKSRMSDHVLLTLEKKLKQMGFVQSGHENRVSSKPAIIERFDKDIIIPDESLFSRDRKVALHVDVILYSTEVSSKELMPSTILIYEAYEGSQPKIKQYLVEVADSLEETIRSILPEVSINRSEELIGVPFI